jgi:thiol-disulfide isomerase/thioredoxin
VRKGSALTVVLIFLILLGVLASGYFFLTQKKTSQSLNQNPQVTPPPSNGESAQILDFSQSIYEEALKSDKLVVLYFYANWCPICRAEFPLMQAAFEKLPGDKVVGIRVNFNDSQTDKNEQVLARQYSIPYQHHKIFLKNGEVVLSSPQEWDEARYISEISSRLGEQN